MTLFNVEPTMAQRIGKLTAYQCDGLNHFPWRAPCEQCGPLPPPLIHTHCHGCEHHLDEHSDGLWCRTCGRQCA